MRRIPKARTGVAVVAMLAATAACSGGGGSDDARKPADDDHAAIHVDHPVALADQDVKVRIGGLGAHDRVTVAAQAVDRSGQPWRASGRFTADAQGRIDLDRQAPRGGRPYTKADSTGLLGAMLPTAGRGVRMIGSGDAFSYHPPSPAEKRAYGLRLTVTKHGKQLADRSITRQWLTKTVRHRKLTVAKNRIDGEMYTPPPGKHRRAPVLVFGGSEGGNSGEYAAALLAARGHPALSLCYFRCGKGSGRPNAINMIDTGYFLRAARVLGKEPGADPRRLAVMGNSRGSEIAQLLGQRHPSVVRDVIAYAPSEVVNGPYLAGPSGRAAWAEHGRPIPAGPIRLDHVRGTVLAIAGGNDKMWGSAQAARTIAAQHNSSGRSHQQIAYPKAGHHVNWFPYGQPGQEGGANGAVTATAGSDQEARKDSWARVLKLLDDGV
ncbi:bile acid acyltransferase/acyl-CoA thioester hydrolase-like protein [Streptomyces sp. Amel2xB2]|uniref:acyl-CoA thioesterase/bile acid-CoA:amino acid N-acyltransferase family protein n=1 Tax=Streptomyces sp. Amel2xB2 TaxID=1305829 RepID=UPI000DC003BA|nr:acyl-CoA thioesterase/bile acid-CoA:amino acid N-acyltransferase family protein [Streptomyces sp. Amel2xB2]RAJ71747.1 bile acid acyltransferase/acyl-CoA thioester hydrolase-like protein [Streptomyces sp. Amel2xB2]